MRWHVVLHVHRNNDGVLITTSVTFEDVLAGGRFKGFQSKRRFPLISHLECFAKSAEVLRFGLEVVHKSIISPELWKFLVLDVSTDGSSRARREGERESNE